VIGRIRPIALLALVLASELLTGTTPVRAGTLTEATDCTIENQTPSISLGAQARYVVHLYGGSGSYSVSFAYGDGWVDSASVSGTQVIFAHWFQSTGTFTQTAQVSSMGSSATCTAQTVVW